MMQGLPFSQDKVRLDQFDPSVGLDRGRSRFTEILWYLLKCAFFLSALPWPGSLKVRLLRAFGASVGDGVVIKPRVNIHLPWKLVIGDHCWIGEEAFLLNFEPITLGSHCVISQRAFLCTGNHDFRRPDFPYRNAPITLGDGTWVGASCFVAPGVTLHDGAIAAAGSVVTRDLPSASLCAGNPCEPRKPRWPA